MTRVLTHIRMDILAIIYHVCQNRKDNFEYIPHEESIWDLVKYPELIACKHESKSYWTCDVGSK